MHRAVEIAYVHSLLQVCPGASQMILIFI
jgi:hypothetical protein